MKKINKNEIQLFVILLAITCIIFAPLLIGHYATDTYNIYNLGYYTYATKYSLNDGRILMGIIGLIANIIKIPILVYSTITLLGAIIISNIAVIILKNIIEKYKQPKNLLSKIITIIISYITVFNFMYLDNMYFVENIVMAISVLAFIKSADILVERNSKYLLKSSILTILGVLCYQGTIGLFFSYVLLFSILKNKKKIKNIIVDLVLSGILAVISVGVDLILVKIIGMIIGTKQTRYGKISNIFTNVKFIFSILDTILIETCNLFPKRIFVISLIILTSIILAYSIKDKENKYKELTYQFLAILIITIASGFVINLTTLSGWGTGRLKNSIGALIGIIFIYLYVQTDIFDKKTYLKYITIAFLLIFTAINVSNYEYIILQHKKVNKLEKQQADQIEEYIEQYEKENDIKVTNIAKINIISSTKEGYFAEIKNKSDFTQNAIRTDWAVKGAFEILENRRLEDKKITVKEKDEYLKNQDGEIGYKCIGDTLFINIYNY